MSAFSILVVLALVLFVAALIKPAFPLVAVGGILLCAALLIGRNP